jgi:hypothetical protein
MKLFATANNVPRVRVIKWAAMKGSFVMGLESGTKTGAGCVAATQTERMAALQRVRCQRVSILDMAGRNACQISRSHEGTVQAKCGTQKEDLDDDTNPASERRRSCSTAAGLASHWTTRDRVAD